MSAVLQPPPKGRNEFINGLLYFWQRGTSFAAIADGLFMADRLKWGNNSGAVVTASQDASVPTFAQSKIIMPYSLKILITTADATVNAAHICAITNTIEGFNWSRLAQRPFILKFWVKSNVTGIFTGALGSGALDRNFIFEYTINAADTWEQKTIVVPASPSAGTWNYKDAVGCYLFLALKAGATYTQTADGTWTVSANKRASPNQVNLLATINNYIQFAGFEMAPADRAFPLDQMDLTQELLRCQRYYEKSYKLTVAPGTNDTNGSLAFVSRTADQLDRLTIEFKAVKANVGYATTLYSTVSGVTARFRDVTGAADLSAITENPGDENVTARPNANTTAGHQYAFHYTIDAEL